MITKFFRITFLIIFCLSLPGKVLSKDLCETSKSSQKESTISSAKLAGDFSDSCDCKDRCNCHCHHGHFDLAFSVKSFDATSLKSENFSSNFVSILPPQSSSLKRPPKIVS